MLAPIAWRTPPVHYGPWELVTSLLTEGLVARGVDVTLYATLDSQTSAQLRGISPHGYAEDPSMDGRIWEAMHVANVLRESKNSISCTTSSTGYRSHLRPTARPRW